MIFYEGHKVHMHGKYPAISINHRNKHIHRLVWEKHYGKIPRGYIIHHRDENKLNWDIDNLELLSRAEHIITHKAILGRKGVKIKATKNGLEIYFNSIEQAAEFCRTYTSSIQRIFKGKQNKANGWYFERM